MHRQVTESCTVCFLGAVPGHAHQRTTDNHHYLNAVQDQGTHTQEHMNHHVFTLLHFPTYLNFGLKTGTPLSESQ